MDRVIPMPFISYTIFADIGLTQVRQVANLSGEISIQILRIFRDLKGSEVNERDVIAGCRIDRIRFDQTSGQRT